MLSVHLENLGRARTVLMKDSGLGNLSTPKNPVIKYGSRDYIATAASPLESPPKKHRAMPKLARMKSRMEDRMVVYSMIVKLHELAFKNSKAVDVGGNLEIAKVLGGLGRKSSIVTEAGVRIAVLMFGSSSRGVNWSAGDQLINDD
jgi:hypothetical protein